MSQAIIRFPLRDFHRGSRSAIRELPTIDADLQILIERIRNGDQQAFTRLYHLTVDRLFALARFILKSHEDAEEVATDVYAQVWDQADSYDASRGSVMSWLLMRCRSRSLDLMRRHKSRQTAHAINLELEYAHCTSAEPGPDDILSHVQEGTAVHRALAELPAQRREVLTLAYFRGMSHVEIAETTGLPIGTVKSHVRRAVNMLRQHIEV